MYKHIFKTGQKHMQKEKNDASKRFYLKFFLKIDKIMQNQGFLRSLYMRRSWFRLPCGVKSASTWVTIWTSIKVITKICKTTSFINSFLNAPSGPFWSLYFLQDLVMCERVTCLAQLAGRCFFQKNTWQRKVPMTAPLALWLHLY